MANNRFLGLQYPLVKTPRGIFAPKNDIDQIKADLIQLILTNPGERVMLPTFGVNLRSLMFEPNDSTLEIKARNMIIAAIKQWEPRVVIQNIAVTSDFSASDLNPNDPGDDRDKILGIKISFFDPGDISTVHDLVIERSISGG